MQGAPGERGVWRWLGFGLAESIAAWSVTLAMIAAMTVWLAKDWIDRYEDALAYRHTAALHSTIFQGTITSWSRAARAAAFSMAEVPGVPEAMRDGRADVLRSELTPLLDRFNDPAHSARIAEVVIVDHKGHVLVRVAGQPPQFPAPLPQPPDTFHILATPITSIMQPQMFEDHLGLPVLVTPVRLGDGELAGWLCFWADGPAILNHLATSLRTPCFVLGRDGTILAAALMTDDQERSFAQWRPGGPIRQQFDHQWYETFDMPCGDGVHVVIAHNVTPIASAVSHGQAAAAILTGSLLIIVALMLMLGVRWRLRPVRALSRVMRQASETGEFDVRVEARGRNEIGAMAAAFNKLARTIRYQLNQLAESRSQAEGASRAKSEFLARMSHEIRTPLTAIIGYAELIKDHQADIDKRAEAADVIHRNGENLLTIINDILDLSKIEAGRMDVERIETDVVRLVEEVFSLMNVPAAAKSVAFSLDVRYPMPSAIMSDPLRLRQILVNLVGNALKFTECGSVTLRVQQTSGSQPRLRFDVIDTGIGMSPSDTAQCFEPFMQADSSMSRRYGGTGLGLPISHQLAQLLGGDLRVESAVGRGSTFSVEIPLELAPGAVMREAAGASSASRSAAVPMSPSTLRARVLLAEDGVDNQKLICFHLRRAGATVDVVADGAAAVEAVTADGATPYDIVLMDMQMPVMDGYTATTRLRTMGYTRPIIALTAHAMTGDREQCLAAGCSEYLSKPVDFTRLIAMCHRMMTESTAMSRVA